jgi:hypothetical protein
MALAPTDELAITEDDLGPLAAVLGELATAGSGWVNLVPEVEPGFEPPPRNLVVAVFSARGDAVPLVTWTPPDLPGRRSTVGIEHGSGPKALARLAELEVPLPAGWLKVADHPRRGLVVTAPGPADPADVARWMLAAAQVLSEVPLTGSWLASVYRT